MAKPKESYPVQVRVMNPASGTADVPLNQPISVGPMPSPPQSGPATPICLNDVRKDGESDADFDLRVQKQQAAFDARLKTNPGAIFLPQFCKSNFERCRFKDYLSDRATLHPKRLPRFRRGRTRSRFLASD